VHQLPASQFHPTLAPISRAAVDANIATGDGIPLASSGVGDFSGYDKSAMLILKVKGIATASTSISTCSSRHTAVSIHACPCYAADVLNYKSTGIGSYDLSYCTRINGDDWAGRYVWDECRAFELFKESIGGPEAHEANHWGGGVPSSPRARGV
ncbi:hypothetical protein EDD21DRAFT_393870, partial [Dissophora ornata]